MNSNIPKSSTQVNNPVKISSLISNQSKANNQRPTSNISSLNRVSILKTEEQKEIVRTNVYDPNDSSPGRSQKFTVVTEIIHRKSNIPFDSKYHSTISLNKMTNNFSFNQNAMEPALNQTFQNAVKYQSTSTYSWIFFFRFTKRRIFSNDNKEIRKANN